MVRLVVNGWIAVLGVVLLSACPAETEVVRAPTQVMLRIYNNDLPLLAEMKELRTQLHLLQGNTWRPRAEVVLRSSDLKWPVDIPVLPPSSDNFGKFQVIIQAIDDGGKVLAETRAISSFVPSERKLLEAWLFVCPGHAVSEGFVCAEEPCNGDSCEVCDFNGDCVDVRVIDGKDLPPVPPPVNKPTPGAPQEDAAMPGNDDGGSRRVDAALPMSDGAVVGPGPDATVSSDASTPEKPDSAVTETPDAEVMRVETCNFEDDDGDGIVDPDMRNLVGPQVHTQAGNAADLTVGQVALLERASGGAWLLYRGFKSLKPDVAAHIQLAELDQAGRATERGLLADTSGATFFAADSDGKWVAVASRVIPTPNETQNDSRSLRISLLRADDMSFVSSTALLHHQDDDSLVDRDDANDCDDLAVLDVAVLENALGQVKVAALVVDRKGVMDGSTCRASQATTSLRVASFDDWGWSVAPEHALGPTALTRAEAQLERVPCRDEWLVAHDSSLLRFSADARPLASRSDLILGVEALVGLQRGLARCASEDPSLLLGYRSDLDDFTRTSVRRLSVNRTTGALSTDENVVALPYPMRSEPKPFFDQMLAVESPGRWFVSARRRYENFYEVTRHELLEINFDEPAAPTRVIALDAGAGARPGDRGPVQDVGPFVSLNGTHAIVNSGKSIVVGLPVMYNGGNLDTFRHPDDTRRAVAVTYRVGCAE